MDSEVACNGNYAHTSIIVAIFHDTGSPVVLQSVADTEGGQGAMAPLEANVSICRCKSL